MQAFLGGEVGWKSGKEGLRGGRGLGPCVIKVYLTVDLCTRPFTQALGLEQLEQCRFIFKGGIAMKQSHY